MNTQLVESLVQVILSLSDEERVLLGEKLSTASQAETSAEPQWTEEAVAVFLSLGRNAVPGRLKNTAVHHDRYLYSNPE
ncbi:MAG: hypothetical protein HC769_02975 [Cyanobacteria bacterium CRU_2_1]|nr:hypothetical protein [Cyanobacteria bacterium RU_5_0]NJR57899.1 hypothetical protein [Cyanobacteria bacterium CRU_2_1]